MKLGEREADITIINSLAHVSTLLRGVQHKRTENNCLAWGMYHAHDGLVQWNHCAHYVLEGSEPRCSEECEHIIVGLYGKRVQVCLFRRCCARFWSLDCCNSILQISQNILSCKVPTMVIKSSSSVNGPYDPEVQEQGQAVCPSVAYLKADRAGELSFRIYKLLFGLKILHWLECCLCNPHSLYVPCFRATTVL